MKRSVWSKSSLGAGLLALTELTCQGGPRQPAHVNSNPKLMVKIFDQAGAERRILVRAIKVANQILRETKIEVEWLECRLTMEWQIDQGCKTISPLHLSLRILPSLQVQGGGVREPMGSALADGQVGFHASVSYRRALATAQAGLAQAHQVLGHAIAHEIGHLLLGENSHSADGIMRAHWRKEELKKAELGLLGFTPQQAEQMRRNVMVRIQRSRFQPEDPSTVSLLRIKLSPRLRG